METISRLSSWVDEGCRIVVSASVSKPWLKCIWGHSYLIAVSYSQKAKGAMQCLFFPCIHKVYEFLEDMGFGYNKVMDKGRTGAFWPCWRERCSSRIPPGLVTPLYPVSWGFSAASSSTDEISTEIDCRHTFALAFLKSKILSPRSRLKNDRAELLMVVSAFHTHSYF